MKKFDISDWTAQYKTIKDLSDEDFNDNFHYASSIDDKCESAIIFNDTLPQCGAEPNKWVRLTHKKLTSLKLELKLCPYHFDRLIHSSREPILSKKADEFSNNILRR